MAQPVDPFGPFRTTYDVHPECDAFIEATARMQLQPYCLMGVDEAREQSMHVGLELGGTGSVHFNGSVRQQTIPSGAVPAGIPITIYRPSRLAEKPAIFVYLHGGGLVVGSVTSYDTAMKTIARDSGAIVVFVTYRLLPLPEDKMAPFDDALTSVRWILDNRASLAGWPDCKVGVGGDSAGGHLTACVTNEIHDLDFQVLVYPMADISRKQASFQEFELCPGLPKDSLDWFFRNSIDQIPDAVNNPKVNPMARKNFELSPPALVLLAQLDALRDCGIEYAERLREGGVRVEMVVLPGVPHAFFQLPAVFPGVCTLAYGQVAEFIRKFH